MSEEDRFIAGIHCSEIAALLSAYYDHEILDEELCRRIEEHVGGCDNCEAVLNTFNKTIELYQAPSGSTEMPEDSKRRLHAALHIDELLSPEGSQEAE